MRSTSGKCHAHARINREVGKRRGRGKKVETPPARLSEPTTLLRIFLVGAGESRPPIRLCFLRCTVDNAAYNTYNTRPQCPIILLTPQKDQAPNAQDKQMPN